MARSSAHAERLSRETGVPTRIVGWYHSHPHITVLPSHVDLQTQVWGSVERECGVCGDDVKMCGESCGAKEDPWQDHSL